MNDAPITLTPPSDPIAFWNYYQDISEQTAIYPGRGSITGLTYVSLGLAGEAGELCDQVKKIIRDDHGEFTDERRVKLTGELGDVLWYWAGASREINVRCGDVIGLDFCPPEVIRATPGLGTPTGAAHSSLVLVRFVARFAERATYGLEDGSLRPEHVIAAKGLLGNVFHAARAVAASLNLDLQEVATANLVKLLSRRDRGVLHGSGSAR